MNINFYIYIYKEKACTPTLKEAYVPDQQSVPRSLMSTDSSNTSLEGIKRGCCYHGCQQVVPLFYCSWQEALMDKGLSFTWKNKRTRNDYV